MSAHHSELTAKRDTIERSACKDARLFSRRCPDDFLDSAEKELSESGKSLKAWRHLIHVYQNDTGAKGKKKDKGGRKVPREPSGSRDSSGRNGGPPPSGGAASQRR